MSDQVPNPASAALPRPEKNPAHVEVPVSKTKRAGQNPLARLFSRLSVMQIMLAIVLALFLWQWLTMQWQINDVQQALAARLSELNGTNKASQILITQTQESQRELAAKVGLLESRFAEGQSQRAALESMYKDLSSSRDEVVLAEIEQVLMLAAQQLQLSSNVKTALIVLQQTDERLVRMNRTALNGLRKAISQDINALQMLPGIDVQGINFRLDNLIAAADTLPLSQDIQQAQTHKVEAGVAASTDSAWQILAREIWGELRQLIHIENMEKAELPLILPEQSFFLRENLKLRLLSARIALLSRDEVTFKRDLQISREWVSRYFDTKSPPVIQALAVLNKMRQSTINIELPGLSSLDAVRHYRISREKGAP